MCFFRRRCKSAKISPELHLARVKDDYLQFISVLYEYKQFMEKTFPKNLDYTNTVTLHRHDYSMRSEYIASIQALYARVKLNYLTGLPSAYEYYMRVRIQYKPVFISINDSFYHTLLVSQTHNNLHVDRTLMQNSSLIDIFKESNHPHIFDSSGNEVQ